MTDAPPRAGLKLPRPPPDWTQAWQTRLNQAHEIADLENRKRRTDVVIEPGVRLILTSPNGERFFVKVSNSGVLSTDPVP